ncbi:MAG: hypothetical protein L6Q99_12015 [Planctomycetes bacterium]|nr:hypothetical protein [Planctomycetota bacterium]
MSKAVFASLAACLPLGAALCFVAPAASSAPGASSAPSASSVTGGEACRQAALDQSVAAEGRRELFFAVLEGLYADGVSNEAVDAVLANDPASGLPLNLVKGCPICMPAYDAFRAYRARPASSFKTELGDGLAADLEAQLVSGSADARFAISGKLVQGWIERRFDARRLSPDERAAWARVMKGWREKGMAQLENLRSLEQPGVFAARKSCSMCDAANAACGR